MVAQYRELFTQVRRYPGMFGVRTYREMVAFVGGVDAASGYLLLEAFHEWMQMRLGSRTGLGWSAIVLFMTVPGWDERHPRQLAAPDETAAMNRAFDLLDEFLAVRQNRGGIKQIYRDFQTWNPARTETLAASSDAGRPAADSVAVATIRSVWIFHGDGAPFASGVFDDQQTGLDWIERHALTGILTEYPIGDGCYDLAIRDGRFTPTKPHHGQPRHIASFGPGGTHIHVTDGAPH